MCRNDMSVVKLILPSLFLWQMWDSNSGESRGSIELNAEVLAFALSPVEKQIAVALSDETVQVFFLYFCRAFIGSSFSASLTSPLEI